MYNHVYPTLAGPPSGACAPHDEGYVLPLGALLARGALSPDLREGALGSRDVMHRDDAVVAGCVPARMFPADEFGRP